MRSWGYLSGPRFNFGVTFPRNWRTEPRLCVRVEEQYTIPNSPHCCRVGVERDRGSDGGGVAWIQLEFRRTVPFALSIWEIRTTGVCVVCMPANVGVL